MAARSLTDRDRAMLDFEAQWWKYAGAKEQAIRDRFAMSGTRYYQILNGLLENQDAMAYAPSIVKRLARMRKDRNRTRAVRWASVERRRAS